MSTPKRILIIDDHPLYRDGLKARLGTKSDLCVVGEAGTCAEGLRQSQNLSPDLAIIDISLPDGSGIELTREIRLSLPDLPVLIVSMPKPPAAQELHEKNGFNFTYHELLNHFAARPGVRILLGEQRTLPPEDFFDTVHLTRHAAVRFSEAVGPLLQSALSSAQ